MSGKEYRNLCLQCLPEIKAVGDFIRNELGSVHSRDIVEKGINSLVTYVDKTAEKMLVDRLRRILPGSGFITEEDTVARSDSILQWIIDPLDGTNNFLHGIPHFAVSVALKSHDDLVIGIILEVNSRDIYYTWKNGGAFLNDRPITVSSTTDIRNSMIATGFPYAIPDPKPILNTLEYFMMHARGMRRFGAAALDMAYVACGRFDVYYETTLNAWDVAAGALLVREAGGTVSEFLPGRDFMQTGRIIATNGHLHQEVQGIIGKNFSPS